MWTMTDVVGLRFVSEGYDRVNLEIRDYQRALASVTTSAQQAANGANTAAQTYLKQADAYKQTTAALDRLQQMQRDSARAAQEIVNRATGVTNAYKSAAESADFFVQALRRQEVEAAKAARANQQLLAQVLGIDQPYRSAKESADVFVQSQERARQSYDQLRAAIDPAVAAQQRLADAQRRVDAAVKADIITRAQGNATMAQYRANLSNTAAAMLTSETAAGRLRTQLLATANSVAVLDGPLGGVASRFSAFGVLIGRTGLIVGGLLVGMAALGTVFNRGVRNLMEWEVANARVNAVLATTGQQVGITGEQIRSMTSQIALATLESEQGVMAAAQRLLTFRDIAGDVFEDVLRTAADMAALGFGTIESETVKLAKALEDPAQALTSLSRAGIVFTRQQRALIISLVESGRQAEAMERILANVNARVGGAAEAAARDTLAGAFDTISQAAGRAVRDFASFVLETTALDRALQALASRVAPFAAGPETSGQELARRRADVARLRQEMQAARELEANNPFVRAFGTAALERGQRTVRGVDPELAEAERLLAVSQERVRVEEQLAAAARARQMVSRDAEALDGLATEIDLRREIIGLTEDEQRLQRNLAQMGLRNLDIGQRVADYETQLRAAGQSQAIINDLTEEYRNSLAGVAEQAERAMDTARMERMATSLQSGLTSLDQQNVLLAAQIALMQQGVEASQARVLAEQSIALEAARTLAAMDPTNTRLQEMVRNLEAAQQTANNLADAMSRAQAEADFAGQARTLEEQNDILREQIRLIDSGVEYTVAQRRAEINLAISRAETLALTADTTEEMERQLAIANALRAAAGDNEVLVAELESRRPARGGRGGGGVEREQVTLQSIIADMDQRIDRETQLLDLQGQQRRAQELVFEIQDQLTRAGVTYTESEITAAAARIAAREEELRQMQELRDNMDSLANTIKNSFASAFTSVVDGTKSAKDAFRDMARAVIAELFRILVVQQLVGQIGTALGGMGGIGNIRLADGGVMSRGTVVPFANGGVVGGPTYFPMTGGRTGLMGEAGPEAIMPLKRGRDGKLGVASEGGGATTVNQVFHFNLSANGDDSVRRIVAQTAPQIIEAAKAGVIDARRRGGAFRATFGG
jgi:hypothetical protein